MAWTSKSVNNNYIQMYESLTVADSDGANVVTSNSSTINHDLSDKKFSIYVVVTEASAGDGGLDVDLQCSPDGTNWVVADADVITDLDTTGLNGDIGLASSVDIHQPYWRVQLRTDGTDTQDSATVKVLLAVK